MSSSTKTLKRAAFWNEHIHSCQRSGLSKARYCRENDLNYQQFIYWVSKHTAALSPDSASPASGSTKLVPVMLKESNSPIGIQLHLPNGVSISGICPRSISLIGPLIEQL